MNPVQVYLEIGQKRVFAGAIEWPGWCRSGLDADQALLSLLDAGPRYARVLRTARLGFQPVTDIAAFAIVERLKGSSTTDFGTPAATPSRDTTPIDNLELKRLQSLLKACWRTFDTVAQQATGQALRRGARGGGRDLEEILQHLLDGDAAYLSRLGWKPSQQATATLPELLQYTRQSILKGLAAAVQGEISTKGPRGGLRWSPRYFVRRVAWHTLDHAWEIEDRQQNASA
jgi:hypothetical protein